MKMDRTEDHDVKQNEPSSERQKPHIFSHMWKTNPKDNYIQKIKHDYIYIYTHGTCL
jgi:hypothetical protein